MKEGRRSPAWLARPAACLLCSTTVGDAKTKKELNNMEREQPDWPERADEELAAYVAWFESGTGRPKRTDPLAIRRLKVALGIRWGVPSLSRARVATMNAQRRSMGLPSLDLSTVYVWGAPERTASDA